MQYSVSVLTNPDGWITTWERGHRIFFPCIDFHNWYCVDEWSVNYINFKWTCEFKINFTINLCVILQQAMLGKWLILSHRRTRHQQNPKHCVIWQTGNNLKLQGLMFKRVNWKEKFSTLNSRITLWIFVTTKVRAMGFCVPFITVSQYSNACPTLWLVCIILYYSDSLEQAWGLAKFSPFYG